MFGNILSKVEKYKFAYNKNITNTHLFYIRVTKNTLMA